LDTDWLVSMERRFGGCLASGPGNGDDADDAETAGSDFAVTRSLAGLSAKWERPLGTHWLPERLCPRKSGLVAWGAVARRVYPAGSASSAKSPFPGPLARWTRPS